MGAIYNLLESQFEIVRSGNFPLIYTVSESVGVSGTAQLDLTALNLNIFTFPFHTFLYKTALGGGGTSAIWTPAPFTTYRTDGTISSSVTYTFNIGVAKTGVFASMNVTAYDRNASLTDTIQLVYLMSNVPIPNLYFG
jgi:hypothetical protein